MKTPNHKTRPRKSEPYVYVTRTPVAIMVLTYVILPYMISHFIPVPSKTTARNNFPARADLNTIQNLFDSFDSPINRYHRKLPHEINLIFLRAKFIRFVRLSGELHTKGVLKDQLLRMNYQIGGSLFFKHQLFSSTFPTVPTYKTSGTDSKYGTRTWYRYVLVQPTHSG